MAARIEEALEKAFVERGVGRGSWHLKELALAFAFHTFRISGEAPLAEVQDRVLKTAVESAILWAGRA